MRELLALLQLFPMVYETYQTEICSYQRKFVACSEGKGDFQGHGKTLDILLTKRTSIKQLLSSNAAFPIRRTRLRRFMINLNRNNAQYVLVRALKPLKQPSRRNVPIRGNDLNWCRSDDNFSPLLDKVDLLIEDTLEAPHQIDPPISFIKPSEVREQIQQILT